MRATLISLSVRIRCVAKDSDILVAYNKKHLFSCSYLPVENKLAHLVGALLGSCASG